jgi:NTP pyrophosphatase (non-canonical NTP hydrolase)
MVQTTVLQTIFNSLTEELQRATEKYGPFKSSHEGYAVILEEVDEMWDEIKRNDIDKAREEALQVAAMAIRFLMDVR